MNKLQMLELLKKDVVPALGCTEPVCVALCAAYAGAKMESEVDSISVDVNAGIYKNGMSAGIPNCTKVGLEWAAALGTNLKNPEKSLELLEDVTAEILKKAEDIISLGKVSVSVESSQNGLYVKCTLKSKTEQVTAIIQNAHTNLVYIEKNGQVLFEKVNESSSSDDTLVVALKQLKISEIRELVDLATEEELTFMLDGVFMNEALAAYSEEHSIGIGIADSVRREMNTKLLSDNLMSNILLKVSSAAESRLDGCPLPTMSSSGAGTKGLVVILPVSETAKAVGASKLKTVRALAFAHLVNRYINAYVGKLSPMCSCVMCSSTAASAGIAYLLGGNDEQIGHAIRNMTGTVTGMICDGGKVGCAMKVSTGSVAALMSAIHAVNGVALRISDGICAETPEACIKHMARVGNQGMVGTDAEILKIMLEK